MTSAPHPQSTLGGNHGDQKPSEEVVGGSTERGNHGYRGPALPPRPHPHPPLLDCGCMPLQQGCTAVCREDCRAGSRREAGIGLECWEY